MKILEIKPPKPSTAAARVQAKSAKADQCFEMKERIMAIFQGKLIIKNSKKMANKPE